VRSLPLWNSHSSSKEPKERKAKTVSVISPLTKPIKLDLLSRESFVRQVANSLRQQIASGELPERRAASRGDHREDLRRVEADGEQGADDARRRGACRGGAVTRNVRGEEGNTKRSGVRREHGGGETE
jgi:hypothetical protein